MRATGLPSCYIRPIAYYGYGEMGLNTLPCTVDVAIACWPWGAYLGADAVSKGVRMKISSWARHDHNVMPPASKTTGNYVNSSLAKVEALKAGYDEAVMLNPDGYVSECTGENIFVARNGVLITPPISAGALEGITQDSVMTIARDHGYDIRVDHLTRSDLYIAEEMFVCGTAAEVERGELGRRPVDLRARGPARRSSPRSTRRPSAARPTSTRTGASMSTSDATDRVTLPERVEIYDTTLRDGSQLEGISLTVDDKLRIAEQLDWLGVDHIEAGWPGANPKDDELFRRAKTELHLETSTLVAFGMTRRVKGKVDSDDTLRHLVEADTATVCIVGKCWDYHVLEALGTTLDEGVAMVADSVAYLKDLGRVVMFDAEHFFDGFRSNPEFSLRVLEGAVQAGVDRLVLCDTNGGSLPADVEDDGARASSPTSAPTSRSACTSTTTPAAAWPNALGRGPRWRDPGPGHDQRLRRAHGELQPHDDHPEPHPQDGRRDVAAGPPRAPDARRPPRGRARQHVAQPAGARTSARRPSRTRPGCT